MYEYFHNVTHTQGLEHAIIADSKTTNQQNWKLTHLTTTPQFGKEQIPFFGTIKRHKHTLHVRKEEFQRLCFQHVSTAMNIRQSIQFPFFILAR